MKVFTNNLRVILGNSRLAKLIKKGILRIFPRPIVYILAFMVACTLIGCATPKHVTQLVHDIKCDTIYINNYQYDSVYVFKDKITDRSRDTLYIKEVQTEYKYRILRDTIKQVQHDTIPYEVTVIQTKEITRPLTFFDKLCRICFYFLSGALFVLVVRLVFRLKKALYL